MKVFDFFYNQVFLKYYKVKVGRNFTCTGRLLIQGHGTYQFGDNLTIYSKETVNPIGGSRTVLQTIAGGGRIIIGSQVGMSHAVLCSRSEIKIEDNVLIGAGVKIFDHDFHSLDYKERMQNGDSDVRTAPILIKEGAFIGAHAIILKGVTIGRHSVIGAGAVVTKNVPDNEVWAGNPAKFVKKLSG